MEHSFDIKMAQEHGVAAAIIFRNFQFWIAKNKANGKNYRDGRTWTYNSMRALADLFPYLTFWKVRTGLETLIKEGILLKANYNKKGYDRTAWYAFVDEKTALAGYPAHLCEAQMESASPADPFAHGAKPSASPTNQYQIQNQIGKPDYKPNNNDDVDLCAHERLELDLQIKEKVNFLAKQLNIILRPNRRERTTFSNIVTYFVELVQKDPQKMYLFTDAVEWARQAKRSTAQNK